MAWWDYNFIAPSSFFFEFKEMSWGCIDWLPLPPNWLRYVPFLFGTTSGLCSSSCCWSSSVAGSLLLADWLPGVCCSAFNWLILLLCVVTESLLAEPLGVPSSLSRVLTMKTMTTATMMSVATIPIKAPSIGVMWKTTAWVVGPTSPARRSTAWPALLLNDQNNQTCYQSFRSCWHFDMELTFQPWGQRTNFDLWSFLTKCAVRKLFQVPKSKH